MSKALISILGLLALLMAPVNAVAMSDVASINPELNAFSAPIVIYGDEDDDEEDGDDDDQPPPPIGE